MDAFLISFKQDTFAELSRESLGVAVLAHVGLTVGLGLAAAALTVWAGVKVPALRPGAGVAGTVDTDLGPCAGSLPQARLYRVYIVTGPPDGSSCGAKRCDST